MKKAVNLTLDTTIIERIDAMRGMVTRSKIINALIKLGLKSGELHVTHITSGEDD